jgi:hypothetical protein
VQSHIQWSIFFKNSVRLIIKLFTKICHVDSERLGTIFFMISI